MALVHDSTSDFVLFPRDQSYLDMLDSRQDEAFDSLHFNTASDMHRHFADLTSSTYDAYPSASAFSHSASNYYGGTLSFVVDAPKENERANQSQITSSGSPSPSVSFDHPPSILSSTSVASVNSTPSSAVGSPYSHDTKAVQGQEQWTDSHQGLGIAPGIAHNEGFGTDLYPLPNLDNDLVFSEDKFSGSFVGESRRIFSSSISASAASVPSSISSCKSPPNSLPAFCASPLAIDTSVATRDVTIDTILNEVNSQIDTPKTALMSPASINSVETSPKSFQSIRPIHHPSSPPARISFKSPTTPASAMSPFASRVTPPPSVRLHESRRNSIVACNDSKATNSPTLSSYRTHPYSRLAPLPGSQALSPKHQSQSPFFGQSSGRFIAPLESSCWFSLNARFFSSLFTNSRRNFLFQLLCHSFGPRL